MTREVVKRGYVAEIVFRRRMKLVSDLHETPQEAAQAYFDGDAKRLNCSTSRAVLWSDGTTTSLGSDVRWYSRDLKTGEAV